MSNKRGIDDQAGFSCAPQGPQLLVPASQGLSNTKAVLVPSPTVHPQETTTERNYMILTPLTTATSTGNLLSSSPAAAFNAWTSGDCAQEL
ncbi:hypothetical protein PPTG_22936 [Phytophthora nicotianae INRA-310]|uniref:Uncharacterized protein n=1 Tax=Phytophthora nicotianae (strain INRA-310) TaxID=761204 RepID=W2Q7S6_PHYN3|nr:hypothetical protein PPTG_22936 [Phytophthora nicotianae INRA-310]ETN09243.1 hypothetical protein PPTG_22936 [Phytophthora nicotianae INRA-310]